MDKLKLKASQIKVVAFDVDGVLTNGEIIYNDKGEEIKIFNAKDGHGMFSLSKKGFITAIITARTSIIVEKRAKDLEILHVYQGAKNKILAIQDLMTIYKLDYSQIAYIGDDIPDICILEKAGLAFCPNDAVDEVKKICHFVLSKSGGRGAVREMTDFLLAAKEEYLLTKALEA
ncbi:MAG: HAD hydrolase family protein [Candidatus Gastranaerophilales bacterium]|nr:HAD hydrolase family protein [Candidatus Gastranaerophilales bacterium]